MPVLAQAWTRDRVRIAEGAGYVCSECAEVRRISPVAGWIFFQGFTARLQGGNFQERRRPIPGGSVRDLPVAHSPGNPHPTLDPPD